MKLKVWLLWGVKLGLVSLILYWLGTSGRLDLSKLLLLVTHPGLSLAALLLMLFGGALLVTLRWKLLMDAQGSDLGLGRLVSIHWISLFFASFLPGSVSGDGVKAFYSLRESQGKLGKTSVLTSLVVDRILGLAGLIFLGLLAFLATWKQSIRNYQVEMLGLLMAGVFVALALFLALIMRRQREAGDRVGELLARLPMGGFLVKVYQGFRAYRHHRMALVWGFILSFLGQGFFALAVWVITPLSCGCDAPVSAVFLATPLGELSTVIPVGPLGIGVGHGAFEYLFAIQGLPHGADTFSLLIAVRVVLGLIGGLPYLLYKKRDGAPSELSELSSEEACTANGDALK
ncbi:MAG: lysylphosphatidylglycerol synthase transmembrane domain-containing protein [bacterium]|nr:lysylphosphatidylglycerol synthase transmembrane domain-containing protein [bacterium]